MIFEKQVYGMQYIKSLFSTGDNDGVNLLAIFLLIVSTLGAGYGYMKFTQMTRELEIVRQSNVNLKAGKDKVKKLNEARNEQQESNRTSGTDDWHDWAERLQRKN